ncbi:hypothetical protein BH10CYA1_BH10CYA1_43450 [soil metagenome]
MTYATVEEFIAAKKSEVTNRVEEARLTGSVGQQAREFLGDLLLRRNEGQFDSQFSEWSQIQAASAYGSLPQEPQMAQEVAPDICCGLAHGIDLSLPVRRLLLSAFDSISSFIAPSLRGETLVKAIGLELDRLPTEQNEDNLISLLEHVIKSPHPEVYPILAALQDNHKSERVKECVHHVLHELTGSTAHIWAETQPDFLSSDQERKEALLQAIGCGSDEQELLGDLFRSFKDWPATNLNCVFLPELAKLMRHSSRFIQLAVVRILIQKQPGNALLAETNPILEEAINTLCSLSTQTDTPMSAQEAALLLDTLNDAPEAVNKLVFDAKTRASEEFIRRLNAP